MEIASEDRRFIIGLGRAFTGALLFALPMLMTMEMWWLGFYLEPWRLILFVLVSLPLLFGLSRFSGFERTDGSLVRDAVDVLVAIAIAAAASAVVLVAVDVLSAEMTTREVVGKMVLQVIPASFGALLARSQLSGASGEQEEEEEGNSYLGELFLMIAGALFLSLNVAPTEEMVLIAYMMTPWHELVLVVLSLLIMHGLVYSLQFRGSHKRPEGASFLSIFARFTLAGYGLVLLVSLGVLWLFGRTDGSEPGSIMSAVVVLAFPGAIGAALGRLVL